MNTAWEHPESEDRVAADDRELLAAYVQRGSQEAFAELVRRYIDLVYHAALRQVHGDTHRAEDVAQTVFTLLARKAGSLGRHDAVAGWLHTTTRFTAGRALRTEQRRSAREREAQLMHELTSGETSHADWERLRPVIDEALDALSAPDRDAVLLRFFAARPLAEIGAVLGVTENAARMRVERALEKLRVLLARRGVKSTSAALGLVLTNGAACAAPAGLAASVSGSALAGTAAGVAAPAVGLVHFMSTSKLAAGAAAFVLIVALGGGWREVRAKRENERALAAATAENDALAARLRELEREAAREKTAAALAFRSSDPAPASTLAADVAAEGNALMARHPEVKRAVMDAIRADFRGGQGAFFRALGLGPEEIEQCIDLQILGYVRAADGPNGPIRFRLDGDRAAGQAQLRALLGEERFQRYQEFSSFLGSEQRPVTLAAEVARAFYGTESPLTATQANRLHEVFMTALVPGEKSQRHYDWEKIEVEARGFLSEAQVAQLGLFRASAQYRQVLDRTGVRRTAAPPSAATK